MNSFMLWISEVFYTFDTTILDYMYELSNKYGNILTPFAKFLGVIGNIPFLLIGWIAIVLFFVQKDKRCSIHMILSLIIGSIIVTLILKNILYRPRPYQSEIEKYNEWWTLHNLKPNWDTSFPSGHACAALGGTLSLYIYCKRKVLASLLFIYPIIIGLSRVYLFVHYPSDVLAGYIVAIIAVLLATPLTKAINRLNKQKICSFSNTNDRK